MNNHFFTRLLCCLLFLGNAISLFAQWTPQGVGLLPFNYEIWGLSVVNEQVVWGIAFDEPGTSQSVPLTHIPRVVRTTDGGKTWKVQEVEEAKGRISLSIQAFDSLTAWITTDDYGKGAGLFKTTDGGITWIQKLNGAAGAGWLHFYDTQSGIAGAIDSIATTTDGGETWAKSAIPGFTANENTPIASGTNNYAVKGNYIWFGTTKGRICRSRNRGKTWQFFNSGQGTTAYVQSVAFRDTLNGMAVSLKSGGATTRLVTNDGGQTWTSLPFNANSGTIGNVAYIPGTAETYIGGSAYNEPLNSRISAYTTDSGKNWKKINNGICFAAFAFLNEKTGWASQGTGINGNRVAVYKWNGNPLVSTIELSGGRIRVEVFPNPVSHQLTLQREGTPLPANTHITLFDAQGKSVLSQPFNGQSIDLRHCSPGLYVLQIEADGQIGTAKIIKQ